MLVRGWIFSEKMKPGGVLSYPIADGINRRAAIKSTVNLNRIEATRIITEVFDGFHALGIEGTVPAIGCEG